MNTNKSDDRPVGSGPVVKAKGSGVRLLAATALGLLGAQVLLMVTEPDAPAPVPVAMEAREAAEPVLHLHVEGRWQPLMEQAVRQWGATERVEVTSGPCDSARQLCLTVTEADYGPVRWAAMAGPYGIKINTHRNHTAAQEQMLACHEVGHLLGHEHTTGDTCMNPVLTGEHTTP